MKRSSRKGWQRAHWLIALGVAGAWQASAAADDATIYRWVDRQRLRRLFEPGRASIG